MKYLLSLVLVLVVLSACKKPEDRKCFKTTGEEITKEIIVPSFSKLFLGPHLKFILVQDTIEKVMLTGGYKLLNLIETSVVDGELVVKNNNKCNFFRTYKKDILVEIHLISITNVQFEGTKELKCKNTLNLNYVTFAIRDGAGEVNLDLNANSLNMVVTNGWGNFVLNGKVNFARFDIRSNGFGDAYNLEVKDSVHIISTTQEDIKVNVPGIVFRTEINGGGNIFYRGTPSLLFFNNYGEGELIEDN